MERGYNRFDTLDSYFYLAKSQSRKAFEYDYGISIANGDPRMAIYDLLGRELDYFVPTEVKSSWSLDMSGYQAGHYIVVMRLHGVLVQQQNIVVTH